MRAGSKEIHVETGSSDSCGVFWRGGIIFLLVIVVVVLWFFIINKRESGVQ